MKYDIIFSLAVHESEECVLDLVENVKRYNPNCAVVVHLKKGFKCQSILNKEYVYINPTCYNTGYMDQSLILVHYSNIMHLMDLRVDCEYLCFLGSNEMFVRHGLYEHIIHNKFSCYLDNEDKQLKLALSDKSLQSLVKTMSLQTLKAPPEGTYYKYNELVEVISSSEVTNYIASIKPYFIRPSFCYFRVISSLLMKLFSKWCVNFVHILPSSVRRFGYASEEFFFPTLMQAQSSNSSSSYCFVHWNNNLELNEEDITKVSRGAFPGKFSVKRVARTMDDPVRIAVNKLKNR